MQKRYLQKLYGPIYIMTIYRYRIDTITDENHCLLNTVSLGDMHFLRISAVTR